MRLTLGASPDGELSETAKTSTSVESISSSILSKERPDRIYDSE